MGIKPQNYLFAEKSVFLPGQVHENSIGIITV